MGNTYHSETKIVYDSSEKTVYLPKTIIERSHFDSVVVFPSGPVDTAKIVERFFKLHYYEWANRDSNVVFTIRDTIGMNRIISRNFAYKILSPKTTTTNTVTLPPPARPKKLHFYAGANFGFDSTNVRQLQPKIGIGWKGWRVDGGYDFLQKNKVIGISKDL